VTHASSSISHEGRRKIDLAGVDRTVPCRRSALLVGASTSTGTLSRPIVSPHHLRPLRYRAAAPSGGSRSSSARSQLLPAGRPLALGAIGRGSRRSHVHRLQGHSEGTASRESLTRGERQDGSSGRFPRRRRCGSGELVPPSTASGHLTLARAQSSSQQGYIVELCV
jgi:hypothetical protein